MTLWVPLTRRLLRGSAERRLLRQTAESDPACATAQGTPGHCRARSGRCHRRPTAAGLAAPHRDPENSVGFSVGPTDGQAPCEAHPRSVPETNRTGAAPGVTGSIEAWRSAIFLHPNTIITSVDLHREDLLATTARERRAAVVATPALPWRALAIRVVAFAALFLGVRG